jgi:hypothetical protein
VDVTLRSVPTGRAEGLIVVSIPREMVRELRVVEVPMPDQVRTALAGAPQAEQVTRATGEALPPWCQYKRDTRTFVLENAPANALPLSVQVTAGSQRWRVEITEVTREMQDKR